MIDLWYKNAVLYCLDVKSYMDSDGDGVGDLQGVKDRLDHIEALGATCLWLGPFYPSPNRDNGYDITDFYSVDPRLGTLGDFVELSIAARDHGMRIIIDLVVNHTSIDHPWFQSARSDPNSPYRDWYVWAEEKPADAEEGVVFPGVQDTTWTYDRKAGRYYHHRFYEHQADLNITNPEVRREIEKIMGFWLELGVSGFRLDAVPFLIEYKDQPVPQGRENPYEFLTELRDFCAWRKAGSILLAEANITMDEADEYFGDGDRMHMIFNFLLNQKLFLAFACGEAEPVKSFLSMMPKIPPGAQWATFLRNHDELDLGRLSDGERQEVFKAFGPKKSMQLYERGIRRRLAPMLEDRDRIKMANSAMFALPGTPVIWYGEELGMGDNLALKEREAVRTPMQWDESANGGFSTAKAKDLVRAIPKGEYAPDQVSAAAQRDDPDSLFEHMERLIAARRACPEVGWGSFEVLNSDRSTLALLHDWQDERLVTLHNFSDKSVRMKLDVKNAESFTVMFGDDGLKTTIPAGEMIKLGPYGFRWLRVKPGAG